MRHRDAAKELAELDWVMRGAGVLLLTLSGLSTGLVAWLATHPTDGDSVVVAAAGPCLIGMAAIGLDMLTGMALSRRLSARRAGAPPVTSIRPIAPDGEEA